MGYTIAMHDTYCLNIMRTVRSATPDEYNEGMTWYDGAHALAVELSPSDPWRGAGVLAAFSPLKRWDTNVSLAIRAFETGIATGHTKTMNAIAQRIINGEPALDALKGDKTRAFCAAIASPSTSTIATIDRHAHDVCVGRVFTDNDRVIGKRVFRAMSAAYVECAEYQGVSVPQIQAIAWVVWRNRKGG